MNVILSIVEYDGLNISKKLFSNFMLADYDIKWDYNVGSFKKVVGSTDWDLKPASLIEINDAITEVITKNENDIFKLNYRHEGGVVLTNKKTNQQITTVYAIRDPKCMEFLRCNLF